MALLTQINIFFQVRKNMVFLKIGNQRMRKLIKELLRLIFDKTNKSYISFKEWSMVRVHQANTI